MRLPELVGLMMMMMMMMITFNAKQAHGEPRPRASLGAFGVPALPKAARHV